jgi:glycosyltransferase involved in cell wall biosynthesis
MSLELDDARIVRTAITSTVGSAYDLKRNLEMLCVIIPAYNEETAIHRTLSQLRNLCPSVEIIVVDDGSTDNTRKLAEQVEGVRVLSHSRNRGYGASIKTGIRSTLRPFVVWYDADGQHRPEDLVRVAMPVIEGDYDAVVGIRGLDSAQQRQRALGKSILNLIARMVSRERIPDLNSGLRCFRRSLALRYLHLLPDGFSASTTSTLMVLKGGYRLGYVPIVVKPRIGTSTVRIFSDGLRTIHLIIRIVVLFDAFRVFTTLGVALALPGGIYGVIRALIEGRGIPTLAGTAIIAGLLTFFMGIIADQVVELRKERFEDLDRMSPEPSDGIASIKHSVDFRCQK